MNKNEKLINHLKVSGFIFPGSSIYGGVKNTWDYGPLGTMYANNIIQCWKDEFIDYSNSYLIHANTLLNQKVWKSSGHIDKFFDYAIDCKNCKKRYKVDHGEIIPLCTKCNKKNFTSPKQFNLMMKTKIGINDDRSDEICLRPELAQGIFINFNNVMRSLRLKVPFSIGQIDKSYRNEVTPRHFIFKTREFTQMELEYFINPNDICEKQTFDNLNKKILYFLTKILMIDKKNIEIVNVDKLDLSHYSNKTYDYMYKFEFGLNEIWGLANRRSYDINNHNKNSNEQIFANNIDGKKIIPWVVESSVGLDRLIYASLYEHYYENIIKNTKRVVLKLPTRLAPYKIAVLSLNSKCNEFTQKIYKKIKKVIKYCYCDLSGSIGKKYWRQDSIGTPYCVTVDNNAKNSSSVTLRFRDSMKQINISVDNIIVELKKHTDIF